MTFKLCRSLVVPMLVCLLSACSDPKSAQNAREIRETKITNPIEVPQKPLPETAQEPVIETPPDVAKTPVPDPSPTELEKRMDWLPAIFPENSGVLAAVKQRTEKLANLTAEDFKGEITAFAKLPIVEGGLGLSAEKLDRFVSEITNLNGRILQGYVFTVEEMAYRYAQRPLAQQGLGLSPEAARNFVLDVVSGSPSGLAVEYLVLHQKAFVLSLEQELRIHCEDCLDKASLIHEAAEKAWGTLLFGEFNPDLRKELPPRHQ